ncbi:hypothetical protein ACLOJK_020749 [Asimina triloba]
MGIRDRDGRWTTRLVVVEGRLAAYGIVVSADCNVVKVIMRISDALGIVIFRDEGGVLFEFFVRWVMKVENLPYVAGS